MNLWLFLAILSRSGYDKAPRFASSRGKPVTYSSRPLYYRLLLLYFEVGYLSCILFYGFSRSKDCRAFCRDFNLYTSTMTDMQSHTYTYRQYLHIQAIPTDIHTHALNTYTYMQYLVPTLTCNTYTYYHTCSYLQYLHMHEYT